MTGSCCKHQPVPFYKLGGWAGSRSSLLERSSANLYVQGPGVGTRWSEAPGHQRLRRSEGEEAQREPGPAGDDGGTCLHSAQVASAPPDGRAVCLGSWTPGQACPRLQSPRPVHSSGAQVLGVGEHARPAGEVTTGPSRLQVTALSPGPCLLGTVVGSGGFHPSGSRWRKRKGTLLSPA